MIKRVLTGDQLIGDCLMVTPAVRGLRLKYPDDQLIYHVPRTDDRPIVPNVPDLLRENPYLDAVFVGDAFVPGEDDTILPVRPMMAYQWAVANSKTIPEGFAHWLGCELDSLQYDYYVDPAEVDAQLGRMHDLSEGKPIVICARHSASCTSNDTKIGVPNKSIPNKVWVEFANYLLREGFMPVAIGTARDERDIRYKTWPGKKLYGFPLREIAAIISKAHATISIDTGPRHLAAAVGANMGCLSGIIPLQTIHCVPVREGQKIYEEVCPIPAVSAAHLIRIADKVL